MVEPLGGGTKWEGGLRSLVTKLLGMILNVRTEIIREPKMFGLSKSLGHNNLHNFKTHVFIGRQQ
jgi:hypothetical protein